MTARDDGSFLIGEDGNVYEGRGWKLKPFPIRRIKDNPSSDEYLQVAFLGTFGGEFTELKVRFLKIAKHEKIYNILLCLDTIYLLKIKVNI